MFSWIVVAILIIFCYVNFLWRPLITKVYVEPVTIVLLKAYFEYPKTLPVSHPVIVNERMVVVFFTNRYIYPKQFPINCINITPDTVYRGKTSLERISSNETREELSECGVVFYRMECPMAKNKIEKSYVRFKKGLRTVIGTPYADQVERDLVFCMRPLHHDQQTWAFVMAFIEIARAFQVNLVHIFISSIQTDLLQLLKMYEIERWVQLTAAHNFTDLNRIPKQPFDGTSEYLAQTAATMDCYHEHRQYTDFITFLDWGDLLLPRSRNSLPLELSAIWGYHPYDVALRVVKHPAIMSNEIATNRSELITTSIDSFEISLEKATSKQRYYIDIVQPSKVIGVTARGVVWKSWFKKRIDTVADGLKTMRKVHILSDAFFLGGTVHGPKWSDVLNRPTSNVTSFMKIVVPQFDKPLYYDARLSGLLQTTNYMEYFEKVNANTMKSVQKRCQIRANNRIQAHSSTMCPSMCSSTHPRGTTVSRTLFVTDIQLGQNVYFAYGSSQFITIE